jgi:broad specificity phosphatase PhoE
MTRTIVHLMRHGEVHNPMGVLYGRIAGYNLSELGHEMAAKVAESLKSNDITHLVASPLERAQQTARPLSDILKLDIVTDERVIEAGNKFEGKTFGVDDARAAARGHEAVIVSHQLPVWTARRSYEKARFAHDPRKRQCSLASLTTLTFDDDAFVGLTYSEPAGDLIPDALRNKFVGGA